MNSKGFTLIEMIVVMAVFLFIVASAIGIFISVVKSESQILSEQQALSQVGYIEQYMSSAIKSAKVDNSGACIGASYSGQGKYYLLSGSLSGGVYFYNSIKFIDGSDLTDSSGNYSPTGYPVCKQISLNTTTNVLEEKKSYCQYTNGACSYSDVGSVTPVALSSSGFTIVSLKFSMDGVSSSTSSVIMRTIQKPFLLADADKNYLGNYSVAFADGTQLAAFNTGADCNGYNGVICPACTIDNQIEACKFNVGGTPYTGTCIGSTVLGSAGSNGTCCDTGSPWNGQAAGNSLTFGYQNCCLPSDSTYEHLSGGNTIGDCCPSGNTVYGTGTNQSCCTSSQVYVGGSCCSSANACGSSCCSNSQYCVNGSCSNNPPANLPTSDSRISAVLDIKISGSNQVIPIQFTISREIVS